jgi:hypothetical protein
VSARRGRWQSAAGDAVARLPLRVLGKCLICTAPTSFGHAHQHRRAGLTIRCASVRGGGRGADPQQIDCEIDPAQLAHAADVDDERAWRGERARISCSTIQSVPPA